jgi:hypothetical protein
MVAFSFPMQVAGSVACVAWVGYASIFKPLTLTIFLASFGFCLVKFGLALLGPSLLLLLPALWFASAKIAKFTNDKIDAFFQGVERLAKAAAAAATTAALYVARRPLAALLCAAFWYALPCKKCAWYTLVLGPVSYRVAVKVALRAGRLREPAADAFKSVGAAAGVKSRAALAKAGRAVRSAVGAARQAARAAFRPAPEVQPGALLAPTAASRLKSKVRAAAAAFRNRASHVTLQDVHSAYVVFAYAFDVAYLQLIAYEARSYDAWLSDTYVGLEPRIQCELVEDYLYPRLPFLLAERNNVMIVIGCTCVNGALYAVWKSETFTGT